MHGARDGEGAPCCIRVRVTHSVKSKLLAKSGEGGICLRDIKPSGIGCINWIINFDGEDPRTYLRRARALSEA